MDRFDLRFLVVSIAAAIASLVIAASIASAQTAPPANAPITMNGYLNCKDGTCTFGLHYVNLVAERTYEIRMVSAGLDPRLMLEALDGRLLAADTDYFDLGGCIVFHVPITGRYRIIANALPPATDGAYTITVRELPVVLHVEGVITNGNTAGHDLALLEGRRYVIDLASHDFGAFVKLLNADGAIVAFEDECLCDMARLVFVPTRTGTYRLVVDAVGSNASGAFTLRVCED